MSLSTPTWFDGRTEWINEKGLLHRLDGPAIEWSDGSKEWWINGKLHREDGPAIEDKDGYRAWYRNGKFHRENGPAVEYPNSKRYYWYVRANALTLPRLRSSGT